MRQNTICILGSVLILLSILNVSSLLRSYRAVSEPERFSGDNVIYKPVGESVPDMVYLGSLSNFDLTYAWAQDKCVPLVREITFENGEVCHLHIHIEHCQLDPLLFGLICKSGYVEMFTQKPAWRVFMVSVGSPSAEPRKGPYSICPQRFVCVFVFSRS